MERKSFLDQEAPAGYVAGIGRGATGFTTSAEHGIGRSQSEEIVAQDNDSDEDEDGDEDRAKYRIEDENGLLALSGYSKEDEEADRIYDEVDRRMQLRNKRRMEDLNELATDSAIKEQFSDLKRELAVVSREEWANIPEVGDLTKRNKRARILQQQQQRFYAVPDSIIAGSRGMGAIDGSKTDFKVISGAKDKMLEKQLDSLMPTALSETDTKDLVVVSLDDNEDQIQLSDITKGRSILASLRKTEPHKASSWIASARLEESAKKFNTAKSFIAEGCRRVPRSEEIWLENIRIHKKSSESNKMCKIIAADALKMIPKSEKLWLMAAELENSSDIMSKRRVLMRALESLPNNVNIWKELINLEDDTEDVKKMLQKATELCSQEWDFWLTLINLSEYKDAKSLLNRARKAMKDNYMVWITALKLEERENDSTQISKLSSMLDKGVSELSKHTEDESKIVNRNTWLNEAKVAENEGFLKTCEAIVINTLKNDNIQESDSLTLWFDDARTLSNSSNYRTVKFIYQYIIDKFPNNIEVWIKLISLIKENTEVNTNEIFEYYTKAVERNPGDELLPLMYAKDVWKLADDVPQALKILEDACLRISTSEDIWIARVKLEVETGNFDQANKVSSQSILDIPNPSPRVWYKHVHLQRHLQLIKPSDKYETRILNLLNEALDKFPDCDKLYLQKGSILVGDLGKLDLARETYSIGVKKCKNSIPLWITLARFEEFQMKVLVRARSILDNAILANPQSDELWNERIDLEKRNNNINAASQIVNKSLRNFPKSSLLWIQKLSLFSKPSLRKNAFVDALKQTENSPMVLLQIGIYFMLDGKVSKARSWLERAHKSNISNGDAWGWLYLFIAKFGTEEEKKELSDKFKGEFDSINQGRVWNSVQKDVQNFGKSDEEILEIVSKKLIIQTN